jgi:hypothetical protein
MGDTEKSFVGKPEEEATGKTGGGRKLLKLILRKWNGSVDWTDVAKGRTAGRFLCVFVWYIVYLTTIFSDSHCTASSEGAISE